MTPYRPAGRPRLDTRRDSGSRSSLEDASRTRHGSSLLAVSRTRHGQRGFTLIEVIIAIMIMAIISLISWRAIDSVALTSRKLDQHTEDAMALQRAFDQFERDIAARSVIDPATLQAQALVSQASQAQASPSKPPQSQGGQSQGSRRQGAQSPSASSAAGQAPATEDADPPVVLPQLLPDTIAVAGMKTPTPRVDLLRSAPGQPDARQRVIWERRGDSLLRAAGPPTEVYPPTAPPPDAATPVLDALLDFSLRAWAPGRGWVALPGQGEQPAMALELVISRGVLGQTPMRYRKVFLLH